MDSQHIPEHFNLDQDERTLHYVYRTIEEAFPFLVSSYGDDIVEICGGKAGVTTLGVKRS
jgi:hypothetical protein